LAREIGVVPKMYQKFEAILSKERKVNYLILILAGQLMLDTLIGLDLLNLSVPFLCQVLWFLYLVLIPGFLLLRILRLDELSKIETIVYSVGLSICLITFLALLVNFLLPLLGIEKPISTIPLIFSVNILVFFYPFYAIYAAKSIGYHSLSTKKGYFAL
jgi:uncharacterized membrane protein